MNVPINCLPEERPGVMAERCHSEAKEKEPCAALRIQSAFESARDDVR
jgi:hypothetical protein